MGNSLMLLFRRKYEPDLAIFMNKDMKLIVKDYRRSPNDNVTKILILLPIFRPNNDLTIRRSVTVNTNSPAIYDIWSPVINNKPILNGGENYPKNEDIKGNFYYCLPPISKEEIIASVSALNRDDA